MFLVGVLVIFLSAKMNRGWALAPQRASDRHLDRKWKAWFPSNDIRQYVQKWGLKGRAWKTIITLDRNKDGKSDYRECLRYDLPVRKEWDSNYDGRIDQRMWQKGKIARYAIDRNHDGKVDDWSVIRRHPLYGANKTLYWAMDNNYDKRVDGVVWFKGKWRWSVSDRDYDGIVDMEYFGIEEQKRPEKNKIIRQRGDRDFDYKWDLWCFPEEKLTIKDENHDGRADAWFYHTIEPASKAKPITVSHVVGEVIDSDFDGKPDSITGKVPKRETRKPW